MLTERGVEVDHTTIYRWVQHYAPEIYEHWHCHRHLRSTSDSWRLDETFIETRGKFYYLWRAIDSSGLMLDFLLTARRDTKAAKRFLRKVLKREHVEQRPRVINTESMQAEAWINQTMKVLFIDLILYSPILRRILMKILGIDLGKYNSVACLLDPRTQETLFFSFKSSPDEFRSLFSQALPDLVVLEACAMAGWVHDLCQAEGLKVLVANTTEQAWCWKHVKRKTDKDDALKLTKLASLGHISPVYVPPAASRQYRQMVKYRQRIVSRIRQVQNTIRALFNQQGIPMPLGRRAWSIIGIEQLSQYRKPLEECDSLSLWQGQLDIELTTLDQLWEHQQGIEQKLTQMAKQDSRVQLLESIPGVGRKTAETVVAFIDDPKRFQNARQVSAYAGLVPRQHQSGSTNRMGKITKRGPKALRTALVEAAWAMLRFNPWAADYYQRICAGQKTRKKQAITALARKLLVRCWTLLRKQETWDDHKAMMTTA